MRSSGKKLQTTLVGVTQRETATDIPKEEPRVGKSSLGSTAGARDA